MNKICISMAGSLFLSAIAFAQGEPAAKPQANVMYFEQATVSQSVTSEAGNPKEAGQEASQDANTKIMTFPSVMGTAGPGLTVSSGTGNTFYAAEVRTGPPMLTSLSLLSMSPFSNGALVTGAPYTATAITETTQVLADGNRISNTSSIVLARDSQGRTRRDESIGKVGPWPVKGPSLVFITDPVAGATYVLNAKEQIATVMKPGKMGPMGPAMGIGMGPVTSTDTSTIQGSAKVNTSQRKIQIMQTSTDVASNRGSAESKTESLGTQTIEGVTAEGTRVTMIIPAGQIGNERPLETTFESWVSPELKMQVLTKRNDPRMGETIYRLTDIRRAEPDHSLFEIPSGFTIKDAPIPQSFHASPAPPPGTN